MRCCIIISLTGFAVILVFTVTGKLPIIVTTRTGRLLAVMMDVSSSMKIRLNGEATAGLSVEAREGLDRESIFVKSAVRTLTEMTVEEIRGIGTPMATNSMKVGLMLESVVIATTVRVWLVLASFWERVNGACWSLAVIEWGEGLSENTPSTQVISGYVTLYVWMKNLPMPVVTAHSSTALNMAS